jgi:hypothetical protein
MYSFIKESIIKHDFLTGEGKCYNVYRGKKYLEPGYVFAPYIPIIQDPQEFRPRRTISSRYATRVVNNSFYGTVTVNGL